MELFQNYLSLHFVTLLHCKIQFKEHGYRMDFSEMYDEAEELRKSIKRDMVETKVEEIAKRL